MIKPIERIDTDASAALLLGAGVGTGAVVLPISSVCSNIHVFSVPLTPGWQTPT